MIALGTEVASLLEQEMEQKKLSSGSALQLRRKNLILKLAEYLGHTLSGSMEDDVLKNWLATLQKQFVIQMMDGGNDHPERQAERESTSV